MEQAELDANGQAAFQSLKAKLGSDEEAAALLAALTASWVKMMLLYSESEMRHTANIMESGKVAASVSATLTQIGKSLQTANQDLKALHTNISTQLTQAASRIDKAKSSMKDILQIYTDFNGNITELKMGISSLAKAALASLGPTVGHWGSATVDRLLGVEAA